jgi:syntaxin 8
MSIPSTAAINQRLSSLSSMVLERSRVVSLKLSPSASTDAQIVRSLNFIRDGLNKIEEQSRTSGGNQLKGTREDKALVDLGERYDRLISMLEEDDIGREKVKGLARPVPR